MNIVIITEIKSTYVCTYVTPREMLLFSNNWNNSNVPKQFPVIQRK